MAFHSIRDTTENALDRNPLRIIVFTLEFTFSPFSGNGVYSRSVIKSLLDQSQNCEDDDSKLPGCCIRVICGKPHSSIPGLSQDNPIPYPSAAQLEVWPVELPLEAGWKSLDKSSPWKEYSEGAHRQYSNLIKQFQPQVIMAIDWHGAAAAYLCDYVITKPIYYFNFRVYASGGIEDCQWYQQKEKEALRMASTVTCLSRGDQISLQQLLNESTNSENNNTNHASSNVQIHLHHPALRGDMRHLALAALPSPSSGPPFQYIAQPKYSTSQSFKSLDHLFNNKNNHDDNDGSSRIYVTCAVRLSEEKMPLLFVEVMERIRDTLSQLNLVPLLCGAASDAKYAAQCRQRLRASFPNAIIVEQFLGPEQLASIFSKTWINFHPCHYDAFGMTVVEAAAFGAPSIVNGNNTVGATELLGSDGCIQLDFISMSIENLSLAVSNLLKTASTKIKTIQKVALQKAMSWDENASGKIILNQLNQLATTSSSDNK